MKKITTLLILLFYCCVYSQQSVATVNSNSIPIDDVTIDMLNSLKEKNKEDSERPNNTRLVQKADYYFNKMWYAEAAELYEKALEKESNHSSSLIKKAGDAYYYNTNMEKAYYWYDILYSDYKSKMNSEDYFRYSHALKGNGKYAKAKRLMRLYNKLEATESKSYIKEKAAILDEIVNSKELFTINNLSVNSKYSDFSPMFYNTDEIVFASAKDSSIFNTRKYKWNNQPYLDLYVAKVNEESSDLKNSIKFSKEINSKYHEASVTFSPDNNTMYFTRNNYEKKLKRDKNGVNHLKIYKSVKKEDDWSEPTELSFNSDDYSTGHPALSADGKLLYFVSDMPGSIGASDIFVVDVLEDGTYSEPRNLGPEINTEKREMFPYVTENKLYFSSNGHVGLGGLDVFEATFDEDGFQEVKNVGKPVNSNKDDFSYIISKDSQKGYFASNRAGGKGDDDIYSFQRLEVEEVNNTAIAGVVTELITGDKMPKALVMLLDENNIKLKEVETDDDGSFVFEDLDGNKKYTIKTNRKEYFEDVQNVVSTLNDTEIVDISLKKLKELIVIEENIKKLKVDMIYFDFDKSFIREDASKELDKLVEVMTEYPEMVIKIESHTDSRGASEYNRYLSDKRAKSSRDYIISQGIDASRIESAIGYGEDRLLNDCDSTKWCTREKHEENRRSEFIIVKM
ncbi:OmpA family protein [Cellulophaga baltica]|uniref:OmpA family protein n=1 Tax=Cellulophaga TaxID=104264 RepID=UPI001C07372D|nr:MULTISPECIES: OmpA family protein [Cellulophaga]MBU2997581.1 OmpA family protein [Cellulophaga baltica]MDO6768976.1 OmpA family protein [Cellulophaga sp. 1_MG-2023]